MPVPASVRRSDPPAREKLIDAPRRFEEVSRVEINLNACGGERPKHCRLGTWGASPLGDAPVSLTPIDQKNFGQVTPGEPLDLI